MLNMAQCDEEGRTHEESRQRDLGKKEAAEAIVKLIGGVNKSGKLATELDILIYTIRKRYGLTL